jgi:hypothetical protein
MYCTVMIIRYIRIRNYFELGKVKGEPGLVQHGGSHFVRADRASFHDMKHET